MGDWYTKVKAEFILNFVEDNRWKYLVTGLGNTLKITLAAVLLGIVIGTLVAIVRSTWDQNAERMRPGAGKSLLHIGDIICKIYLTVIRGTPVVVQLMIMFYIIFATSRNGVGVAMLAFGVNSGAYVAELIRGGIMAIDKGQLEAGRSLGFDYVQTMRFIIVPQERAAGAGKRVYRAAEGNVRRRLRCRDGPHKGRRYHPRAHLLGVHAADRRSAHLSCDGHVLYLAGREIREEAAQQ